MTHTPVWLLDDQTVTLGIILLCEREDKVVL